MTARTPHDPAAARAFALDTLQRLAEQQLRLDEDLRAAALAAYAVGGLTWKQIGLALGVTGSIAWHLAHPGEEDDRAG